MQAATANSTKRITIYRDRILSFLLALYCLPQTFRILPGEFTDSSWMRALSMAVSNKLVFGRDFIFTYGPLGFLSTRVCHHSLVPALLLGDIFLFTGYYYFIYKYIAGKKWFFIVLPAMLLLRSDYYNHNLFIIYILITCTCFTDGFRNRFALIYTALAGVLLFFIKMNYGVITGGLTLMIIAYLLFTNKKAAIIYALTSGVLFSVIYQLVHIDLRGYLKYGMVITGNFDESMYLGIPATGITFLSAMTLILVFLGLWAIYLVKRWSAKQLAIPDVVVALLLCMSCFLLYKNGFTRADYYHYGDFFSGFPFFIIAAAMIMGYDKSITARIVMLVSMALSTYIIALPDLERRDWHTDYYLSFLTPAYYIETLQTKADEGDRPHLQLDKQQLQLLGNATIDIYPTQVALLQYNHLNYHPRPVPQSYSVYAPVLDSLNAAHISNTNRPQLLMVQNEVFDNRYAFADESMGKAALHLNYRYSGFISTGRSDTLENRNTSFLLLHATGGKGIYPVFTPLATRQIKMGETIPLDFNDTWAVYLKADVQYSFTGRMRRIFYRPPAIDITIYFEDGVHYRYRAIVPLLKDGILINRAVLENTDLKNFITGDLLRLKKIKAFSLDTNDPGVVPDVNITLARFINY